MATVFVDMEYVKLVGTMPPADIDAVEEQYPGTFLALATSISGIVEARLRKRYVLPFQAPYPEAIRLHVAQIVAYQLFLKRGFNPGSAQDELIEKAANDSWAFFREAADGKDGLLELPRVEENPSGEGAIARGGPIGSSNASPYDWVRKQRSRVRRGC